MEYPTITVISPLESKKDLDITIAHELGHNWFSGALATNERDHPGWTKALISSMKTAILKSTYKNVPSEERTLFETFAGEKVDQPIETASENFS
jgi:hypothetical protein